MEVTKLYPSFCKSFLGPIALNTISVPQLFMLWYAPKHISTLGKVSTLFLTVYFPPICDFHPRSSIFFFQVMQKTNIHSKNRNQANKYTVCEVQICEISVKVRGIKPESRVINSQFQQISCSVAYSGIFA